MQSKGIVKTFVVLLTLACLLTYGSMWRTSAVEADARDYAHQVTNVGSNKLTWQANYNRFIDSISGIKNWGIPYVKEFSYAELKKTQLGLGLDLKGGMSVVMQVELRDFIKSLSGNSTDPSFIAALDQATEAQKTQQTDYITLFANAWREKSGGKPLAPIFTRSELLNDKSINLNSPDGAVEAAIRQVANGTVEETYKRLKQRIDKLGVVQPNVSLDAQRDLILVDLPGIDDPVRARKFLQQSAKLEFWETYRMSDAGVAQGIVDADKRLKAIMSGDSSALMKKDSIMDFPKGPDGMPDTTKAKIKVPAPETAQTPGPILSKFLLNVGEGGQVGRTPILGYADKSNKEQLDTLFARPEIKNIFPADMKFLWSLKPIEDDGGEANQLTGKYYLYAIKKTRGGDEAPLDGSVVTGATADPDPKGQIGVTLRMNNEGARKWATLTKRAADDGNREIAIALDDEIVSAPSVNGAIEGGVSSITGGFTIDEARDLSRVLEVGKLPAGVSIIQESQIGPSLGQDNINASLLTMFLSVLLLCGFMIAYYAKGGIVSVIALLANIFFLIGTLASLGTVLTLPGIAGIVLTLASAVDANVVIYERIREEMRAGLTTLKAIGVGFSRALPAILDANVTTLLTAGVLIYFGLGPIKGFGVVLLTGILSSLFTALLLARLLTDWYTDRGNEMTYSRPWSANVLTNVTYDWIGRRKYAYMFSGAVILIGIASFFARGFELGVDFKGGYSFNVVFEQPVNDDAIRAALTPVFDGKTPIVKSVSTENTYNITTSYLVEKPGAMEEVVAKLHEGLKASGAISSNLETFKNTAATGSHIISSSQVGATVADDIRSSSFKAAFMALTLIFLFLLIRFRRWQFSLGAVLALLHDVLLTLTFFTLLHGLVPFSLEIDQAIIACILTVIGYSVNDTVIVYDRIREFIKTFAGMPKEEVFNRAINTTLTRTLITSGTVFMVVFLLFLFGGAATKGFAFGMLVGMFFGTYSSIFVASALVVDLTSEKILSGKADVTSAAPAPAPAKKEKV
jgi:SecD/SecF fusion protein